jgi:hypothetical protein
VHDGKEDVRERAPRDRDVSEPEEAAEPPAPLVEDV